MLHKYNFREKKISKETTTSKAKLHNFSMEKMT
jgi:hypothetical protein